MMRIVRQMSTQAPIVVFDFDFTLTAWDTAMRFFRWLILRRVWRLVAVALALPILGILFLGKSTRKWPIRFAVWVATLGLTQWDLRVLARYHAKRLFADAEPVFFQDGLATLALHVEKGDSVVIATGCLEILAKELLVRVGFGHIALVGSTLRPFLGGMVPHQHCFGPKKVEMLTDRGFAPPWEMGYTDSMFDLPVLQHCRERHLVNAKAKCVRVIEQSLASKVIVLAWQ
jgi:phosphatidylglycerophosphatase C